MLRSWRAASATTSVTFICLYVFCSRMGFKEDTSWIVTESPTQRPTVPDRDRQEGSPRASKLCAGMARWAPPLLTHVNLLLTVFGGAALATAARLKWDPSTYVALRELFPAEYRVTAATLVVLGVALLLAPHIAAVALHVASYRLRRALLFIYVQLVLTVCVVEALFVAWLTHRIVVWLKSPEAEAILMGINLTEKIKPVLHILSYWHPLPKHIENILDEAREDAPRNAYVGAGAGAALVLLQLAALILALLAKRGVGASDTRRQDTLTNYHNTTSVDAPSIRYEKLPLRTAYKNGRIVIL